MNRIKELRKAQKINQESLASILNVSRATISKYETRFIPLTDETISLLTDYFNVSSDYLLGRTDDPTPPDSNKKPPPAPGTEDWFIDYLISKGFIKEDEEPSEEKLLIFRNLIDKTAEELFRITGKDIRKKKE